MKDVHENQELTIRQRLVFFLGHINESHKDFYGKTALSDSFLRHKRCGINSDSLLVISKVYPTLNLEWLITGVGYPVKPTNPEIIFKAKGRQAEISIEQLLANFNEYTKYLYLSLKDTQKMMQSQDKEFSELKRGNPDKNTG